jgi:hypothetical protein
VAWAAACLIVYEVFLHLLPLVVVELLLSLSLFGHNCRHKQSLDDVMGDGLSLLVFSLQSLDLLTIKQDPVLA